MIGFIFTGQVRASPLAALREAYEAVRGPLADAHILERGRGGVVVDAPADGSDPTWGDGRRSVAFVGRPRGLDGWGGRLEDLDGQFALFCTEGRDRTVVATDAFGMQAVFYAQTADLVVFSTSAIALARYIRATPLDTAAKVFLRAGYLFGSLTLWDGVERLEPGRALVVENDKVTVTTYYRPRLLPEVQALDLRGAVASTVDALVGACAAHLGQDEIWADLTGGFDTRLMCLGLAAAGVPFRTNTVGSPDDADVRLGAAVAATAGWEWERISPETVAPPDDRSWAEVGVAWSDGSLPMLQVGRVLASHAVKAATGPRRLANGGAFEHARGAAWLQEFHRGGRTSVVNMDNWIRMRCLHPMDMRPFAYDFTDEVEDEFRQRMLECSDSYRSELNAVQLGVMLAYRHTGHFGAWSSTARAFIETDLPAYFRHVFETMFSVQPALRQHHSLQRHMLARLDPGVASVRTTNGGPGAPLSPTNAVRFAPVYGRLARRAAAKFAERLGWRPHSTKQLLAPAEAIGALAEVDRLGLLRADAPLASRVGHLLAPGSVAALAEAVRGGDLGARDCIDRIVTLETAWGLSGA
ncbi:MAG TPA: hypothetical protein VFA84_04685 [Acidimicrobiales bacterium]|nr:hypothetical protein [Acidimicrobiales bacterium]